MSSPIVYQRQENPVLDELGTICSSEGHFLKKPYNNVNGEWRPLPLRGEGWGEGVRATSNEQPATKRSDGRNCPEVFLDKSNLEDIIGMVIFSVLHNRNFL